jgi:hypothetical protein
MKWVTVSLLVAGSKEEASAFTPHSRVSLALLGGSAEKAQAALRTTVKTTAKITREKLEHLEKRIILATPLSELNKKPKVRIAENGA